MPTGTNPAQDVFLNLLYPWDPAHLNLFKSVTWTFWKDDGDGRGPQKRFANYAAQDYGRLVQLIDARSKRPKADVYVALGTQRMADSATFSNDGHPKAMRTLNNIVSLNSIWLDLDVKAGAYATTDDAFEALDDFVTTAGLPPTTMEVLSGSGGVHAYWCTGAPMPVAEWIPLATALRDAALGYGLKFDPQVTMNAAGVLRVPGTLNYKSDPPGVVSLMTDTSFTRYAYADLRQALPMTAAQVPASAMLTGTGGRVSSMAQNFIDNTPEAPPVSLDQVAEVCPTIDDILSRGGNGDVEPLWNMAMLLASFTDDPVKSAHRLSSGDPRYVAADTDKKLMEKINARANNQAIGWPQCSQFSPLSAKCGSCSLLMFNKSPLNHVKRPAPAAAAQLLPTAGDPLLPNGYWRDVNKHVITTISDKAGNPHQVDVLGYPILDAGIDPDSGDLVVRTIIGGSEAWGSAPIAGSMQPGSAAQAMATGARIFIKPVNHTVARDFLVAWMTKLQDMKRNIPPASYGWTDDGNGFTFGDKTYRDGVNDVAFRGSTLDKRFAPKGDPKPWQDAMALVYGRPALETLVATAFAAPLVELAGPFSLVMSAYSRESGVGKTTALSLAQGVWGHPREGMTTLADTQNSVMKKIQDLKSLPIYWDELRTRGHLDKVIDMVFGVTQGKGKARLNRDISQAEAGAFTTMFVVASNYGIANTVYAHTDGTEAGGLRVFEIEVPPVLNTSFTGSQSQQLIIGMSANYGHAGAQFAEFLVKNRKMVRQQLGKFASQLEARYQFSAKERFWATTVACLMVGATLANHIGLTKFNLKAISDYLDETVRDLRVALKEAENLTLADPDSAVNLLNDMISAARGRHLITTNIIRYATRGNPGAITMVDTDPGKLDHVWIQNGSTDGRVRAVKTDFDDWLRKRGLNPKQFVDLLERHYVVNVGKQTIGSGVPFFDKSVGQLRRYCYDLTPKIPGSIPGSS